MATGGTERFDPLSTIDGHRHRITLGLRRLELADWLLVDDDADSDIRHKQELLASEPSSVLQTTPESDQATAELLEAIVTNLSVHHPSRPRTYPSGLHPLHSAALLVQEDLCVLTRGPGGWTMTAGCVCFPSRWRLADKMGRSVAGIHAPVPGYATISDPVDAFFDRLSVDRPMWRTNWTLTDDPALHQPAPARSREEVTDPGSWTFRVERQTVRRLPTSGAAVFTIRTYRRSLARVVVDDPAAAAALATTVEQAPAHLRSYRAWQGLPTVVSWLREHASLHRAPDA